MNHHLFRINKAEDQSDKSFSWIRDWVWNEATLVSFYAAFRTGISHSISSTVPNRFMRTFQSPGKAEFVWENRIISNLFCGFKFITNDQVLPTFWIWAIWNSRYTILCTDSLQWNITWKMLIASARKIVFRLYQSKS